MNSTLTRVLRIVVALILLQTLYFKFTGAEESVLIFSTLGVEPWGRISSGIVELIATILLFLPSFTWIGAVLAAATMAGAIMSHFLFLGIEVAGDGGLLFILAWVVLISSLVILWNIRKDISFLARS